MLRTQLTSQVKPVGKKSSVSKPCYDLYEKEIILCFKLVEQVYQNLEVLSTSVHEEGGNTIGKYFAFSSNFISVYTTLTKYKCLKRRLLYCLSVLGHFLFCLYPVLFFWCF